MGTIFIKWTLGYFIETYNSKIYQLSNGNFEFFQKWRSNSKCIKWRKFAYSRSYKNNFRLEILALWVFLGANAQLLMTSLAGARMPLKVNVLKIPIQIEYT